MNLTTPLRDTSQGQDEILPQSIKDYDPLVLLIVVAVLSTLLAVVFMVCLLWICFKCCIQSVWFLKPRSWPSHSKTFPPSQRDFVEMNEIDAGRNSIADRRPRGLKSVFASNRTGISERLGYGRANRKVTAIPFLPPPKTWTPSPPFPPDGHLPPARPNPRRPDPEPIHLRYFKNDLHDHAKTQCQYCGTIPCCPAELGEKLKRVKKKSRRSFKRTKFDLNRLSSSKCSALRPPHNTPCSKVSSPNISGNPNLDLRNDLGEEDSVYEIFPERNLMAHTGESKYLDQTNPEAHSTHSLGHSSKYPMSEHPVCYSKLKRSYSQPEIGSTDLVSSSVVRGCNVNESSIQTVVKTTGARKKRRASIKARKNKSNGILQNGMPPPVEVFIESPSSSSSSSTDLTTILNRSQKIYWKIYHPPEGEKTFFFEDELSDRDESDEGQIKDGNDDDEYATDATPSMSWDHLTPDPSPIPNLSNSEDRIIMNVAADPSVHYSANKGSAYSVGNSNGNTPVPRGMYSNDDRHLEHRNYTERVTNPFNSQCQQPPVGNL